MQSPKPSVAAIVVTFNRKHLLLECLETLLSQTYPLASIIIVDNASTDGTYNMLKSQGMLEHPYIDYLGLSENTGGAGGFFRGVQRGYERGFNWLWLMDDDVEPNHDCLQKLIEANDAINGQTPVAGLYPLKITPSGRSLGGKLRRVRLFHPFQQVVWHLAHEFTDADLGAKIVPVGSISFEGVLIPASMVARVGYPEPSFFICCDDFEYASRLRRCGEFFLIPGARMLKKILPGQKKPTAIDWKRYYAVRNRTYIFRQIGPVWGKAIDPFLYMLEALTGVLRHRKGLANAKLVFQAARDGWLGRLGKTIDPIKIP